MSSGNFSFWSRSMGAGTAVLLTAGAGVAGFDFLELHAAAEDPLSGPPTGR